MVKQVSVEQAFQWAQAIAVREWRLLLPVALAFFCLPGLLIDVFLPNAMQALLPAASADPAVQGRATLALLAMFVVNMAGALAVTAMALVPGISVSEAIGRALRRLPTLIGAVLMVTAVLLAGVLVLALALGTAHTEAGAMQAFLLILIFVVGGALWVRFSLVTPLLVERGGGPAAVLQRSWGLTGGAFWRILGALLVYFVGGTVVLVALSSAVGALVALGAQAAGAGSVRLVLVAVLFRALAALVSTGFQLVIAGLYRQLASRGI